MRSSENKKQALIDATGVLIVKKGDSRVVTTREIAEQAHTSKCCIAYYFGNKAGLIQAVLDDIAQVHGSRSVADYLATHRRLLDTREGRIKFINGMMDAFFYFFSHEEKQVWQFQLRYRIVQSYHETGDTLLSSFLEADMRAFYEIFQIVTGCGDLDMAYAWFMNVMLPLSTRGFRKNKVKSVGKGMELSPEYDRKYLEFCKQRLLEGWGLLSSNMISGNPQPSGLKKGE